MLNFYQTLLIKWLVLAYKDSGKKEYRYTLTALCKESNFIELMKQAPEGVEVSSLPKIYSDGARTTISIVSYNNEEAKKEFQKYVDFLEANSINYGLGEE